MSGRTATVMRKALQRWRDNTNMRDQIIIDALAAGMTQREITRISGVSRKTIGNIIRKEQERRWAHLQPGNQTTPPREPSSATVQASNSVPG